MTTKQQEYLSSYRGPLTSEHLKMLRDMQGWIEYCIDNGYTFSSSLQVLGHDVNGLLREGPEEMMPQSSGYAKYLSHREDLSGMADDPNPNAE